jgi:hypothetical protein
LSAETGNTFTRSLVITGTASIPVTITGIRTLNLSPEISATDFSHCNGVAVDDVNTCTITYTLNSGTPGTSMTDSLVVDYTYNTTQTGSSSYPVALDWKDTTKGATTAFQYPNDEVHFYNVAPNVPITPSFAYTDASPETISFMVTNPSNIPAGITFDENTGTFDGNPIGTSNLAINICLVKSGLLTIKCKNLVIKTNGTLEITTPGASSLCTQGGTGTSTDPYQIHTVSDFDNCLRAEPTKAFILKQNLDLSSLSSPITEFNGTFDGGGMTLSQFSYFDTAPADNLGVGLFRKVQSGVIKNLIIDHFFVSSSNRPYQGILVGVLEDGILSNIEINAPTMNAHQQASGGVVGSWLSSIANARYLYDGGLIDQVKVTSGTLNGVGGWGLQGGIVGLVSHDYSVRLTRSSVRSTTLSAGNCIGGIVGFDSTGQWLITGRGNAVFSIEDSYSTGTLNGGAFSGGIIGCATNTNRILNVGSTMALNSSDPSYPGGGLIGYIGPNPDATTTSFKISNSFFTGSLSGPGATLFGAIFGDTSYRTFGKPLVASSVYYRNSLGPNVQSPNNTNTLTTYPIASLMPLTAPQFADPSTFLFWSSPWALGGTLPDLPY